MSVIHSNSCTCSQTTRAAAHPLLSGRRNGGDTVYDAVSAVFLKCRRARGHGTADLLTENSLRGGRMLMLLLIIIAELLEQSDGYYTSSKKNTDQDYDGESISPEQSPAYRFKRLLHIAP